MARPSPQTERLIALVDLLTSRPGLTLSEIARRLGVDPATCHPMLAGLTRAGWLVRHPTRRTYRLGPALVAAGQAAAAGFPAIDFAHPIMVELQHELGLACLALAPGDNHATLVDVVHDPRVPGPAMRIGDQTPFHAPLGISYMAWADDPTVQRWLERGGSAPATRAHYARVLEATRRRGFAVELATPPEARVRDALTDIGHHLTDNGPRRGSSPRLRALLEELAGELAGDEEFSPVALVATRTYRVSSISASVFDAYGDVTLLLALRGFADTLQGRQVTAIGQRLVAAADRVTAAIGGRRPDTSPRERTASGQ